VRLSTHGDYASLAGIAILAGAVSAGSARRGRCLARGKPDALGRGIGFLSHPDEHEPLGRDLAHGMENADAPGLPGDIAAPDEPLDRSAHRLVDPRSRRPWPFILEQRDHRGAGPDLLQCP